MTTPADVSEAERLRRLGIFNEESIPGIYAFEEKEITLSDEERIDLSLKNDTATAYKIRPGGTQNLYTVNLPSVNRNMRVMLFPPNANNVNSALEIRVRPKVEDVDVDQGINNEVATITIYDSSRGGMPGNTVELSYDKSNGFWWTRSVLPRSPFWA